MASVLQMSQVTVEKCMEIISEFEPSPQGRGLAQLGIDGELSVFMLLSVVHELTIYCWSVISVSNFCHTSLIISNIQQYINLLCCLLLIDILLSLFSCLIQILTYVD